MQSFCVLLLSHLRRKSLPKNTQGVFAHHGPDLRWRETVRQQCLGQQRKASRIDNGLCRAVEIRTQRDMVNRFRPVVDLQITYNQSLLIYQLRNNAFLTSLTLIWLPAKNIVVPASYNNHKQRGRYPYYHKKKGRESRDEIWGHGRKAETDLSLGPLTKALCHTGHPSPHLPSNIKPTPDAAYRVLAQSQNPWSTRS